MHRFFVLALSFLALAACCGRSPQVAGSALDTAEAPDSVPCPAAARSVTAHHRIGDFVLRDLVLGNQEEQDAMYEKVLRDMRTFIGPDLAMRAEGGLLSVDGTPVEQERVAMALRTLRSKWLRTGDMPRGESAPLTSRRHDLGRLLLQLPDVRWMGPNARSGLLRDSNLMEELSRRIWSTLEDGVAPSLRMQADTLIGYATSSTHEKVARALDEMQKRARERAAGR